MNELEKTLYRSRKSVLEACAEIDIKYPPDVEISALRECTSCGIWLKTGQMKKDADDLDICKDCLDVYGA